MAQIKDTADNVASVAYAAAAVLFLAIAIKKTTVFFKSLKK